MLSTLLVNNIILLVDKRDFVCSKPNMSNRVGRVCPPGLSPVPLAVALPDGLSTWKCLHPGPKQGLSRPLELSLHLVDT